MFENSLKPCLKNGEERTFKDRGLIGKSFSIIFNNLNYLIYLSNNHNNFVTYLLFLYLLIILVCIIFHN
jgi:hypothetical protein